MIDKNGVDIETGDMIRFSVDKYVSEFATVKELMPDSNLLQVAVLGVGKWSNRLVPPNKTEVISD